MIEAFKEKHKRNSDKDGKAEAQNNIDKLLKGISDKYKAEGIDVLKLNLLAWLEHRRWTAFTRTRGYRYTAEINKNLELNGTNHKNMELKLHPCLIEAKKPDKEYFDYISMIWQKELSLLSIMILILLFPAKL